MVKTWIVLSLAGALLAGGCSSSGAGGNVAPRASSAFSLNPGTRSAFRAGLRGPRGLRTLRQPRPYATRQTRHVASMRASPGSGATFSPASRSGAITINHTSFAWGGMDRTLHIYSGISETVLPYAAGQPQARPGTQPFVSYDPMTDTWSFQ